MKTQMIHIKKMVNNRTGETSNLWLNPNFVTAVREKDELTEIEYFSSTGSVMSNMLSAWTMESAESVVKRLTNQ